MPISTRSDKIQRFALYKKFPFFRPLDPFPELRHSILVRWKVIKKQKKIFIYGKTINLHKTPPTKRSNKRNLSIVVGVLKGSLFEEFVRGIAF